MLRTVLKNSALRKQFRPRFFCEPVLTNRHLAQKAKAALTPTIRDWYLFGSCEQGQLGLGYMNECVLAPKRVDSLEGIPIQKIIVGHNHSMAILKDGSGILTWGYNQHGQLGQGHKENCATPALVKFEGHEVTDGACGPLQSFVLTTNQRTGKQAIWHFGMGYLEHLQPTTLTLTTSVPTKVKKSSFMGNLHVHKVVPGSDFCLWVVENGQLMSFGTNQVHGALGNPDFDEIGQPTVIPSLQSVPVVDVAIGWGHVLALTAQGEVYSWGSNLHGQCGHGYSSEKVRRPEAIRFFVDNNIVITKICCGESHSMALDEKGQIWSWGSHKEGKLGFTSEGKDHHAPRLIDALALEGINITHISSGTDHSAAISDHSEIFVWGFGQHGALSVASDFENMEIPLMIPAPVFKRDDGIDEEDPAYRMFNPPHAVGYKKDHTDYPFLIDGQKVSEGHFFDEHYGHKVVDVQCGMDMTVFEVVSTLKE